MQTLVRLRGIALALSLWHASAADAWRMTPVTSYQARVESFAPMWDDEHGVFVSGVPLGEAATFEARYAAVMDSVTTSSVEGALMYLQRDCIDVGSDPSVAGCQRKNNASFITFLEMEIAQPAAALAEYQDARFVYPEFCPFVMMEGGACVPYDGLPDFPITSDSDSDSDSDASAAASASSSSASESASADEQTSVEDAIDLAPPECQQFHGLRGQPCIGPCVGAQAFAADMVSPYLDTVWFSYPNSCVMSTWVTGKTAACRRAYPGGLCAFGHRPDGANCSFSFRILGFLAIDELVGITNSSGLNDGGAIVTDSNSSSSSASSSMDNDGQSLAAGAFTSYADFCAANNVEFHSFDADKTLGLSNVTAIPFWESPSALPANVNRTARMIALYNAVAAADASGRLQPLPMDLDAVRASNPPCFANAKKCFDAPFGCERHSYAQVCSVCRSQSAKCVARTATAQFPALAKAERSVADADLRSGPLAALLVPTLAAASPATAEDASALSASASASEVGDSSAAAAERRPWSSYEYRVLVLGAAVASALYLSEL